MQELNLDNNRIMLEKKKLSRNTYEFLKRLMDIICSMSALIVLAPILIVVAILIKIESKGPVIFSQERVGINNKKFKMYKFRSMVVDADKKLEKLLKENEVKGAMFKMKEDPRITRVGKFIRKHSLDELPQLWNVLAGDMTLVGPRPPLEREVADYSEYDKQRLIVKPGCTGLWQVSGRNNVGFKEMVELDLKYIRKSDFWFDSYIILKTFGIIVIPNDAY